MRVLLALLVMLWAGEALAQLPPPRVNAIQPELVAEHRAVPGQLVELAIVMHSRTGWHGYWQNPGDAGLPMQAKWTLPAGAAVGPLRYPVPERLMIAGLMNYVYERDHAILLRLTVPADAAVAVSIRAQLEWLACTDKICVPERGEIELQLPVAAEAGQMDPRFDAWRQALPRPLASPARFAVAGNRIEVALALPASVTLGEPYLFPLDGEAFDLAAPQRFRRDGDVMIASLAARGSPRQVAGVLALGDGRGLSFEASPGEVPKGGSGLAGSDANAILLAVLGALAGGVLFNLMPCVFPILAVKAIGLARLGGDEKRARRESLAYGAGAIVGTSLLGAALLAIRAGGSAAGWAFQLQDPRAILLLALLATAITMNLLRVYALPALAGEHAPAGSFGTGALAAFVATPCTGPFLGAALGAALLLPAAGSIAVFAALGLGLALPFVAVAFIPSIRRRLPRPGPWMIRLQHILAIPMALTAAACLWLLWRQGGTSAVLAGLVSVALLVVALVVAGRNQRRNQPAMALAVILCLVGAAVPITGVGRGEMAVVGRPAAGSAIWSDAAVASAQSAGKPVFVYFTADWCLTCKANEAAAIDRKSVQAAFREAGVVTLVGDWTNGDPAITRLLESRGRAGVPLYLWYAPGSVQPEELPQLLTPAMLIERAQGQR